MNIGAILPHTYLYGGVKRFIELGRAFQNKGHRFTIYTPSGAPPEWTRHDLRYATFDDLKHDYNDMLFITDRKNKDILTGADAQYKIFYHVSLRHKARTMIKDKRLHTFACSTNIYRYDKRWFRTTPFLAMGGINNDLFYARETRDRKQEEPFTILFYGRLSEHQKGSGLVVKACERLYKKYPFIRLLLFDTPVNRTMSAVNEAFTTCVPFEFVMNHPVEKNVELFHRADIFVSAEKQAGWANTVAEAMACGIPVVTTHSGTLDMIVDGETGIFVGRNARSISKGIEKLILSVDLRRKLSANGSRYIRQFDWKILAERILGWYDEQEKVRKR
jgi:glycosyltransferase involved in cell wall biosynthesis